MEDRKLTFNRFAHPIAKDDLVIGAYYIGICRNANIARWDGKEFHHWRYKFGMWYVESIKHREDEEKFDVFDAWWTVDKYTVLFIPIKGLDGNHN